MSTETSVETTTDTETETMTRTASACAMGAGGAAVLCKGILISFVLTGLGIAGLSAISPTMLMIAIPVLAAPFVWKGFRWAGRRPVFLGLGGLVGLWGGYYASGIYASGPFWWGMNGEAVAADPIWLLPIALLYVSGAGLFLAAIYDSYMKEMDMTSASGGMGAGIVAASICGGGPFTQLAGAGLVLLMGPSVNQRIVYKPIIGAALLAVIAYTIYTRAIRQTLMAAIGAFIVFISVGPGTMFFTFPDTPVGEFVSSLVLFFGLGLVFFGLVWAYYPEMNAVPTEWKARLQPREPA